MKRKLNRTKKAYIEHLNDIYSPADIFEDFPELIRTSRDKLTASKGHYGNLLKKYDPIAFNVGLQEWQS